MANIPSQPGRRSSSLPEVERPSSRIWQPLEAESIRWEGQVLVVGEGNDLPALMVITRERVAIISNGLIALEVPREWLRPAAELAAENGIRLFISPDTAASEVQPILLRARAGRGAAAEMVAVLTGRPLPLQPGTSSIAIPNWREKIGASAPVALPAIEDNAPEAASTPRASWPPVEQEGVLARPQSRPQPQDRPMQSVADQRRRNMSEPTPVPIDISRAARKLGTSADGFTITEDGAQVPVIPMPQPRGRSHHVVAWTLRAAIVLMLIGTIGYFGRDRIEASLYDIRDRIPADVQRSLGITDDKTPNDVAITTETNGGSDGTNGAFTAVQPEAEPTQPVVAQALPTETQIATEEPSEAPVQQTDPTANIGGPTGELPPTKNAEDVTADPTMQLEPVATEAPTEESVVPTEVPVEPTEIPVEPTAMPTEIPVEPTEIPVEPTAVPTEIPVEPTVVPTEVPVEPTEVPTEATVEPTEVPTEAPTEAPTPEPTEIMTEAPTETPEVEPTEVAREVPTQASTPEPTEEPTVAPEPTLESQEPSVLPETTPEQAVVSDGFRYSIEGVSIGDTVPELPEINSVGGYGEWVVLSVYGQNMSADAQVFDMSNFKLYADGQELLVDVGNAWVSGMLGDTPAYGNTDAIQWAPGESHSFTLTYLAPPAAQTLVLQAGNQTIDLSPAIVSPQPLFSEQTPVPSDLMQAKVVDVIDAETIVIEMDGVQQTVRYLSIDAPTGDACYAAEATEANRSLVEGQTVTLERQATDVNARGNWVRDVWVTNEAGQAVLVSQQLVQAGAAETNVSVPNTRFAGWLESSEVAAQDAQAGMWGNCGE